ncbi:MAG: hypothetical protein RLN62_07130 [Rickettsiales bacterium]
MLDFHIPEKFLNKKLRLDRLYLDEKEIILNDNQIKIIQCIKNGTMYKNIPDTTGIKSHNISPILRSLRLKLQVENNKELFTKILDGLQVL